LAQAAEVGTQNCQAPSYSDNHCAMSSADLRQTGGASPKEGPGDLERNCPGNEASEMTRDKHGRTCRRWPCSCRCCTCFCTCAVLLIAIAFVIAWHMMGHTGHPDPTRAPFQEEATSAYDRDLSERWGGRLEPEHTSIANEVVIHRNISDVFRAITTSSLWVTCYPETVGVGGTTKRPFKAGDLVLEKFMFAGTDYSVIRYQVATYTPPHKIVFHGDRILVGQTLLHSLADWLGVTEQIGGTFEYDLEELQPNLTKWVRRVHFYHNMSTGNLLGRFMYRYALNKYIHSQQYGAALYVECTRRMLETEGWETELFG